MGKRWSVINCLNRKSVVCEVVSLGIHLFATASMRICCPLLSELSVRVSWYNLVLLKMLWQESLEPHMEDKVLVVTASGAQIWRYWGRGWLHPFCVAASF